MLYLQTLQGDKLRSITQLIDTQPVRGLMGLQRHVLHCISPSSRTSVTNPQSRGVYFRKSSSLNWDTACVSLFLPLCPLAQTGITYDSDGLWRCFFSEIENEKVCLSRLLVGPFGNDIDIPACLTLVLLSLFFFSCSSWLWSSSMCFTDCY